MLILKFNKQFYKQSLTNLQTVQSAQQAPVCIKDRFIKLMARLSHWYEVRVTSFV